MIRNGNATNRLADVSRKNTSNTASAKGSNAKEMDTKRTHDDRPSNTNIPRVTVNGVSTYIDGTQRVHHVKLTPAQAARDYARKMEAERYAYVPPQEAVSFTSTFKLTPDQIAFAEEMAGKADTGTVSDDFDGVTDHRQQHAKVTTGRSRLVDTSGRMRPITDDDITRMVEAKRTASSSSAAATTPRPDSTGEFTEVAPEDAVSFTSSFKLTPEQVAQADTASRASQTQTCSNAPVSNANRSRQYPHRTGRIDMPASVADAAGADNATGVRSNTGCNARANRNGTQRCGRHGRTGSASDNDTGNRASTHQASSTNTTSPTGTYGNGAKDGNDKNGNQRRSTPRVTVKKRIKLSDRIADRLHIKRSDRVAFGSLFRISGTMAMLLCSVAIVAFAAGTLYSPFARNYGMAASLADIQYRGELYEQVHQVAVERGESGNGVQDASVLWDGLDYGIDVSAHNGDIDWARAVEDGGVQFAILRCGFGDANGGEMDKKFIRNVEECNRLNIPYGIYLYSYAMNEDQARTEAEHALQLIEEAGANPTLPVYYDLEDPSQSNCDYVAFANIFCEIVQDAGYVPGVYASTSVWKSRLNDPSIDRWDKWVAQYNDVCTYEGDYSVWQYSSEGEVPGSTKRTDVNVVVHGDEQEA